MLLERLNLRVKQHPTATAIASETASITYGELWSRIASLSASLQALGVTEGSAIGIVGDRSLETIAAFLSAAHLGAIAVPLSPELKEDELRFRISTVKASWLVAESATQKRVTRAMAALPDPPRLLSMSDLGDTSSGIDPGPPRPFAGPFLCLFSSGSTGRAKRVVRSQLNLCAELDAYCGALGLSPDNSTLLAIPSYHSYGIMCGLLPSLLSGGRLLIAPRADTVRSRSAPPVTVDTNALLKLIAAERVSLFPSVPFQLRNMLDRAEDSVDDLSSLRWLLSGGAPLSQELRGAIWRRFGVKVRDLYGCSEAGTIAIDLGTSDTGDGSPWTVLEGVQVRAFPMSSDSDVGEIAVRGATVATSYPDLPEVTKEAFRGGWFRPGDLGRVDAAGHLTLAGRTKLLIDTGGEKVDPLEVEGVLQQHPGVADAVVIGIESRRSDQIAKAIVVATPDLSASALRAFCRERLADFKVPKSFSFVDHIPHDSLGKVRRAELVAQVDASEELRALVLGVIRDGLVALQQEPTSQLSFTEFGIDSAMVVEMHAVLERELGPIPRARVYEHDDFGDLLAFLHEEFTSAFEALAEQLGADAPPATRRPPRSFPVPLEPAPSPAQEQPVAIVGLAGRYPDARDVRALWNNLVAGRESIREIPVDRWNHDRYFDPIRQAGRTYTKWGSFLEDIDHFDAALFEVSPREARLMDPQERLLLEVAWEALEDAGYPKSRHTRAKDMDNTTGVYVGVMWGEYQFLSVEARARGEQVRSARSGYWSIANRISHFFNLRGPSMAVDSACSSSLTALHLATRAILAGECSMALVGGVNLTLHPEKLIKMADEGLASADGHTRSFSANADGFSVGEGVGALVLKPLASALRDEDMIYGLVRGTAANHGGRSRSYRVPNPRAQASVIGRALDAAQVPPDSISYVEANGGATMLGDPLEVRALSLGYGVNAGSAAPCAIGSIKSNLGNLEAASGVAAVTKVLLQFRHRMLVPSLHADDPNPDIALEQTRFELQAKAAEWGVPASPTSEDARPLRAAINSFGAGGANAHVILEEWPRRKQVGRLTGGQRVLLVLSAMSELQLNDYAARIASFIETDDGRSASVQDIAFTLQGGREELPHRAALITTSLGEARQQLRDVARGACPATGWRAEAERTPGVLHDNASLEELASHWVKGGSVQWRARVAAFGGQRVSLPAYPFQKTSHWFTERPGSTTNEDATLSLHRTAWLPVQLSHVDGRSKAGWVLGGAGRLAETLGLVWVSSAEALAEALTSGRPRPDRIVVDATEHQDATDIPTTVQAELALAAAQLQALLTEPALAKTRVVWVTSSAVSAGPEDVAHDLSRAPLWGAVRGWRSQHPHRGMRLVDLGQRDADRDQLWSTILADEEPEFAIRHDAVLRPVLQHVGEDPRTLEAPAGVAAWHVEQSGGGLRDGLSLVSAPKVLEPLSAGEVRLEMRSLGLNLLDVVRTLGMVDVADRPMLGEGAGVVAEVGPLVQDLREGDRVMGLLRTAGGPTAVASRSQLAPIPPGLSDVEAATIPVNFLTALLGLDCLAQLQPGERVLIHAAAGGTGMAAVQLARRIGAEVFATASEHKWPLLRAMGLDDAHLASSRDTGFADHFLSSTNGEGVDVVLNSLAGKFVDASLRVLRPGGRFLEMGKTDIRDADALERRYPQVVYRAFDLTSDGESVCQELLVRIASLFARGLLSIPPLQTYDLRHAPLALRHMASARHVGKIVLQVPRHLRNGGTVLIANAGGPMGRALAHHLIREHDVRHLLVTLESAQGSEAEEFAAELKSAGVESVEVMGCDLAQPAEVERMLGSIPAEHGLTGVFYFAPSAVRSSRPKLPASPHPEIASAWHLHTLTEHLDLSTFVTVSPAPPPTDAGSLSPSTAAGSFLDALASYRKKRGLAGLSFAWPVDRAPPLDASRNSNAHSTMFASDTLTPVSVARAMQWMERAMQRPEAALVALGAESVSHPKLSGAASARSFSPRSAGHRRRPATPSELRQRLAPLHQSDRLEKLSALVREETADVLGLAGPRAVPVDRPLSELGLDSLMGVELSTQLSRWVDAPLPSSLVFDHPTPRAITQMLLARAGFASVSSWTDDDIRAKLQRLSIPDLRGAGPLLQQLMKLREAEPRAHERSDAGTTIDALAGDSLLLHAEHVLRGDA